MNGFRIPRPLGGERVICSLLGEMNGFGLHVIPMVGLILLSWLGLRSLGMEKGERPRLRQDGPRDAHSPRLSFLEAKALKRRTKLCFVATRNRS